MRLFVIPMATAVASFGFLVGPSVAADMSAASTGKVYALAAQNSSGETGTVALIAEGKKTLVEVAIVGAPADIPQPAHVHTGSCDKLDPVPKYPLTSVKNGISSTTLDVPVSTLIAGGFAVNIHKSADDLKTYVACSDLKS